MAGVRLLRRSLLNFCGGQMSHKKKQDGVGGDVQIEIDEAMNEEAGAGNQAGDLQSSGKRIVELTQSP